MPQFVKIAASQEELCRIYLLRYSVYIEEMGFSYPYADHEKKMLFDEFDPKAIHFYVDDEETQEAIGIYRFNEINPFQVDCELESRYHISAFSELGLKVGYSSKLMTRKDRRSICTVNSLMRAVFNYGVPREYFLNFIDCSPSLVPFYERVGFRKYTHNFIDPILGEKTPMVLFANDVDHLKKVKSPFYNICIEKGIKKKDYSQWLEYSYNDNLMVLQNA